MEILNLQIYKARKKLIWKTKIIIFLPIILYVSKGIYFTEDRATNINLLLLAFIFFLFFFLFLLFISSILAYRKKRELYKIMHAFSEDEQLDIDKQFITSNDKTIILTSKVIFINRGIFGYEPIKIKDIIWVHQYLRTEYSQKRRKTLELCIIIKSKKKINITSPVLAFQIQKFDPVIAYIQQYQKRVFISSYLDKETYKRYQKMYRNDFSQMVHFVTGGSEEA